jgi:hypothetical protein
MWPFSKKFKTPERLPIDGPWSVGEGENDGKTMIVRCNTGYQEFGRVAAYEHQVGIAVPLRAPEPSGLPSPEEDLELGQIEDTLCQVLKNETESLFVATITTSGMREFVFYTRAPESVEQRFEQLRGGISSHEIQLMIQLDKDWEIYGLIASG